MQKKYVTCLYDMIVPREYVSCLYDSTTSIYDDCFTQFLHGRGAKQRITLATLTHLPLHFFFFSMMWKVKLYNKLRFVQNNKSKSENAGRCYHFYTFLKIASGFVNCPKVNDIYIQATKKSWRFKQTTARNCSVFVEVARYISCLLIS